MKIFWILVTCIYPLVICSAQFKNQINYVDLWRSLIFDNRTWFPYSSQVLSRCNSSLTSNANLDRDDDDYYINRICMEVIHIGEQLRDLNILNYTHSKDQEIRKEMKILVEGKMCKYFTQGNVELDIENSELREVLLNSDQCDHLCLVVQKKPRILCLELVLGLKLLKKLHGNPIPAPSLDDTTGNKNVQSQNVVKENPPVPQNEKHLTVDKSISQSADVTHTENKVPKKNLVVLPTADKNTEQESGQLTLTDEAEAAVKPVITTAEDKKPSLFNPEDEKQPSEDINISADNKAPVLKKIEESKIATSTVTSDPPYLGLEEINTEKNQSDDFDIQEDGKPAQADSPPVDDPDEIVHDSPATANQLRTTKPENAKSGDSNKVFKSASDSHFFIYFLMCASLFIIGYVAFHNKYKVLAYVLEGKRSKNGRRRPNSANYRKLDTNLEEAITSNTSGSSVTHVIY